MINVAQRAIADTQIRDLDPPSLMLRIEQGLQSSRGQIGGFERVERTSRDEELFDEISSSVKMGLGRGRATPIRMKQTRRWVFRTDVIPIFWQPEIADDPRKGVAQNLSPSQSFPVTPTPLTRDCRCRALTFLRQRAE